MSNAQVLYADRMLGREQSIGVTYHPTQPNRHDLSVCGMPVLPYGDGSYIWEDAVLAMQDTRNASALCPVCLSGVIELPERDEDLL